LKHFALQMAGVCYDVLQALDMNEVANAVYAHNFPTIRVNAVPPSSFPILCCSFSPFLSVHTDGYRPAGTGVARQTRRRLVDDVPSLSAVHKVCSLACLRPRRGLTPLFRGGLQKGSKDSRSSSLLCLLEALEAVHTLVLPRVCFAIRPSDYTAHPR
jgi:hypothetical protein